MTETDAFLSLGYFVGGDRKTGG